MAFSRNNSLLVELLWLAGEGSVIARLVILNP
jgi:hypothetical protein